MFRSALVDKTLTVGRTCPLFTLQSRSVVRIPPWEYHIRFSPQEGRKMPSKDMLDRYKRLNNGMWIHRQADEEKKYLQRNEEPWLTDRMQHHTCTPVECHILDRVATPFWLRPKYYIDDPYANYHVRHGVKEPRVDYGGKMTRERRKILLEDTVADQHFYDR